MNAASHTRAWSHPAFAAVARFVSEQTGLSFDAARGAGAEAGICRAMKRAGVADVSHYAELLHRGRIPLDDLLTELTVGETYFFREPGHFAFIRATVFPDVLARRGADHVLRIWSAGCATGEEPYSLAIVLDDAGLRGQVLATDISRAALERAREATYRAWSLRGLDRELVHRLFRQVGDRWRLDPRFREGVTFRLHNLAQDVYPSRSSDIWGMDLILCRNVLLYFDSSSIARVAQRLHDSLADGGWLITGSSDPPLATLAPFDTVVTGSGVFYRKEVHTSDTAVALIDLRQDVQGQSDLGQASATGETRPPAPVLATPAGRNRDDAPPPRPATAQPVPLAEARQALAAGDYERVLTLTRMDDPESASLCIRALANARGSDEAAQWAQMAAARHPLSIELHLIHALLLIDLKRHWQAEQALRRVLYLDPSLAIANYLLGSVQREQAKPGDARRAYRNARDLARAQPPDAVLPFADGERAAALAAIAAAELATLEAREDA